jgi:pyrimidine-nucleoside phosphorylase
MLVVGKRAASLEAGREMAQKALGDGTAFEKFRMLVQAQGGDVSYVDKPDKFPRAKHIQIVKVPRSGYIGSIDARAVGEAAVALGAGRARKGDPVDHAVGFTIHHDVGDKVSEGEPLFTIHANDRLFLADAWQLVTEAHSIVDEPVKPLPLFYE